ncbi:MAG: lipoate--protein ligase [Bacteroidales bacterium]|nr:lipoate--protein ligase [Bacteroidales bacterium]
MRFIWLPTQNPHHNLAVEAYLLQETEDEVFMLWQNDNSVIIGRHQNALAEINREYVEQNHVVVARRLTGGGAVFHDLGNLNFSFIQNISSGEREIDFVKYLQPIVEALHALGVNAEFSGRNDLLVDGKKISGNAMAFYGNRVLEHGTLLFSTVQNNLVQALKVDPDKFKDKAVKSVRSRVTNISEHLSKPMTVLEFKDFLMDFVLKQNNMSALDVLMPEEESRIAELERTQFSTWDWNYGQSPKYVLEHKVRTAGGTVQAILDIKGGRIAALRFYGDFFSRRDPQELEQTLVGTQYTREAVEEVLGQVPLEEFFSNTTKSEIVDVICG